jgi:hypothetical protein
MVADALISGNGTIYKHTRGPLYMWIRYLGKENQAAGWLGLVVLTTDSSLGHNLNDRGSVVRLVGPELSVATLVLSESSRVR